MQCMHNKIKFYKTGDIGEVHNNMEQAKKKADDSNMFSINFLSFIIK